MLQRDSVEEAIRDGRSSFSFDSKRPLANTILGYPFRDYFIDKVKAPFLKCVLFWSNRYPEPTKENTAGWWTHPFIDIFDRLIEYANYRKDFFKACKRLFIAEVEHDSLYRDPMIAMLEWTIEAILDNKILPRSEGNPPSQYWSEPTPYGGQHSIIYKMIKHRKEINDLLGRETK